MHTILTLLPPEIIKWCETREWTKKEGLQADGFYYTYLDYAGYKTIGIGQLNEDNKYWRLTLEECYSVYYDDCLMRYNRLSKIVKDWDKLNAFQKGALVAWNRNTGRFISDLFDLLNTHKWDELYKWWTSHYVTAAGKYYPGLVKLREIERDYFFGDYGRTGIQSLDDYIYGKKNVGGAILIIFAVLSAVVLLYKTR